MSAPPAALRVCLANGCAAPVTQTFPSPRPNRGCPAGGNDLPGEPGARRAEAGAPGKVLSGDPCLWRDCGGCCCCCCGCCCDVSGFASHLPSACGCSSWLLGIPWPFILELSVRPPCPAGLSLIYQPHSGPLRSGPGNEPLRACDAGGGDRAEPTLYRNGPGRAGGTRWRHRQVHVSRFFLSCKSLGVLGWRLDRKSVV